MKLPRRLRKAIKRNLAPYLFISSPMLSILILVLFPVLFALYVSFTNWHLVARSRSFVGLANYIHVLKDSVFHICLWNTTYFTLVYVSSVVILGLILALMLQKLPGRFRLLMRYICFAPVVTSMVAISIVWKWLYQPSFGVFNYVLGKIGIGPYNWLTNPKIVMDSIILMTLWKSVGFVMIIFVAGLVGIPEVYYEAAKIDGATPLRALWHITLPLLKNTTLFISVITHMQ